MAGGCQRILWQRAAADIDSRMQKLTNANR